MMNHIKLLFFTVLVFISCSRTEDNSRKVCKNDCTTIKGKVTTSNLNEGVFNAEVVFYYKKTTMFSNYERVIGKAKTETNGDFTMDVFIKDEELGENPDGRFFIEVNEESLSGEFPKSELLDNSNFIDIQTEMRIESILSRDTLFNYEINIPKKETITITVLNFSPSTPHDYISISNHFPNDYQSYFKGQSTYRFFEGDSNPITKDIIGGRDLLNTLFIWKSKNGENTTEMVEILFEENNSTEYIIEY